MKKYFSILVLFLLLNGCASTYVQPTGSNIARLRISAPDVIRGVGVNALVYPSGKCEEPMQLAYLGGSLNYSDLEPIGIPGSDKLGKETYFERVIKSGKKQLFSVRVYKNWGTCVVSFSIKPEQDKDYEATVSWNDTHCFVKFSEIRKIQSDTLEYITPNNMNEEKKCIKGFN